MHRVMWSLMAALSGLVLVTGELLAHEQRLPIGGKRLLVKTDSSRPYTFRPSRRGSTAERSPSRKAGDSSN